MPGVEQVLPIASSVVGAGLNIYNAIQANKDRIKSQRQLDTLAAQPWERYNVNPAINRYYQTASTMAANPYGFSAGERGAFNQNLSRTLSAQNAYATNMSGGNLGKAINFLDVNPRITALNDFAGRDASLRRSFQNDALGRQFQGANAFQNIDNLNTQTALQRRMQALQAYGTAVQTNKDFVRNTIGGIGRDLLTAGAMNFGGNVFGGGKSPNTAESGSSSSFSGDIIGDLTGAGYNTSSGLTRPMRYNLGYNR